MEPDRNDPTTDQILKVVEHHYFQALVEKRVGELTEARLSRWRKQITAPVVIALSVAGWLGYRDLNSVKALTDATNQKIEESRNRMAATLKDVESQGSAVAKLVEQSKDQINDQMKEVSASQNLVAEGKQYLSQARTEAQRIAELQAKTVQDALNSSKDSTAIAVGLSQRALELAKSTDDVNQTARTIRATKDEVVQQKGAIDQVDQKVAAAAEHVLKVETNIREDQALRDEMIRARTFAPLILRSGQEVQVDVLDPRDALGKQKYRVFARADDVKTGFILLRVRVTELWSGISHPEEALPRLTQNNPFPLKEAPGLAMYVDSIKHQTLSHTFALLHVGAAEGSLH